jgi:histidinol-phosphatase
MYWAEKGKGAFKNGERIYVSEIDQMSQALFNFGGPDRIMEEGLWDGFCKLIKSTCRQRGFGDYLGFALVFEGKAEAMLEVGVKPWDLAPMKIIVEEAGGIFVDLAGGKSVYQGGCIVSNTLLAQEFKNTLLKQR